VPERRADAPRRQKNRRAIKAVRRGSRGWVALAIFSDARWRIPIQAGRTQAAWRRRNRANYARSSVRDLPIGAMRAGSEIPRGSWSALESP